MVDPRKILDVEPVALEDVKPGDFIAGRSWSRPRLVLMADATSAGQTLLLADPDSEFASANGVRKLTPEGFAQRAPFRRYPQLTALWAAAKTPSAEEDNL
jgi:hypothetical protein